MSSGFWGGFGAGFAKTFDPVVVGKGLGEAVADYKEGKAVEAAEEKKKQAIATLDKERFQSGATTQPVIDSLNAKDAPHVDLSAVPNPSAGASGPVAQGQAIDPNQVVSAKDVAPGNPMSDATYDRRMAEIENDYKNATQQARADYYRFRGMNKEQEEAEKKLKDMQFAQKYTMFHKKAIEGDRDALKVLVGYANETMGNGMRIDLQDNGRMMLYQGDKLVNDNFTPSRAQLDDMATRMYVNAKFMDGGSLSDYLSQQKEAVAITAAKRGMNLADDKFAEQKRATAVAENQGQQKIDNDMYNAKEDRALKRFGIETTASTADKDRASREAIATNQIQSNEKITAENNKTKVLTTGMNNQTTLTTNAATNATNKAIADSKNKTTMDVTGMNIQAKKDLQKADQEHGKEMQTSEHQFKAGEAEKGREFTAGQKLLDRAHEAKLAKDRNDVTVQGQILSHADNQGRLELERGKFKYQKEKDAEAKALAAKELARKNGLQYVQNENTGEHVLYDMGSGTPYGTWDRSVGTLIIDGYSKESVKRLSQQAESLGAELSYEYVPDRMTGRMRPKYVYVVDGKLCDTIDEVKQVKGITR